MKVKCLNRSSIKTKQLIRNEFAKMLKEKKELSKISVTELVNNLDINRGTFYSHYSSIYEIAKELQNEALDLLNDDFNSLDDISQFINKINLFLKSNTELYSAILRSNDPMIFMERLNKIVTIKLMELLTNKNSSKFLELNISVFVSGIIKLYIKYFRNELNFTLDEINDYSKILFENMFLK